MALDVTGFKQGQRKVWSAGDYPDIAQRIESAAEHLVSAAGVEPGQDVLDVATGSGNVALLCAQRGANVTGLDLTPELFDAARRRAADAGVDLPVGRRGRRGPSLSGRLVRPRAVDVRHDVRAAARSRPPPNSCASRSPGGTIAVAAWTPEGANGQMFRTVASHMPPPPPELKPPTMWGDEELHARAVRAARSGA